MVIMLAILERRRSGWLSTSTKELEDDDDIEKKAIVELDKVVVAIVSVTTGSNTIKKFNILWIQCWNKIAIKKISEDSRRIQQGRRRQREREKREVEEESY